MNNKGFAITTVIYGLSILGILLIVVIMGSLSTNRANIKNLSKNIDNELNFYSRASISYAFTEENELQQFEVPVGQTGWYRVELWGASGNGANGGKGAYTTGIIWLTEGDLFYIKVGGSAEGKVGGSTDFRLVEDNGKLGLLSRLMVAAGGGTEIGADGGTICGYNLSMTSNGGAIKDDYHLDTEKTSNYIGTLHPDTSPKSANDCVVGAVNGVMKSSDSEPSSSGDGYFVSNASGANKYGGSSYISGYAGITPATNIFRPPSISVSPSCRFTYLYGYAVDSDGNITGGGDYYSEYIFRDGLMLPGVKTGDGAARIEKLSVGSSTDQYGYYIDSNDALRNKPYFYNIRSITDCSSSPIKKLEVMDNGYVSNFSTSAPTTDAQGRTCVTYTNSNNWSSDYYYDEIVLWHNAWENIGSEQLTINYAPKGQSSETTSFVIDLSDAGTETLDGYRISAYQPDYYHSNLDPVGGNYYVFSILSENKVVSAQQSNDSDMNPVKLDPIVGESRQKWSIEAIPEKLKENASINNEYSMVELTRYGALTIELDENMAKNKVIAYNKFNKLARNTPQIWRISPVGNGTYRINTPVTYFDTNTGSLLATPSKANGYADHADELVIAGENVETARFKFYKLDY